MSSKHGWWFVETVLRPVTPLQLFDQGLTIFLRTCSPFLVHAVRHQAFAWRFLLTKAPQTIEFGTFCERSRARIRDNFGFGGTWWWTWTPWAQCWFRWAVCRGWCCNTWWGCINRPALLLLEDHGIHLRLQFPISLPGEAIKQHIQRNLFDHALLQDTYSCFKTIYCKRRPDEALQPFLRWQWHLVAFL